MADEAVAEQEQEPAGGNGRRGLIMTVGVAIVTLVVGLAGGYFLNEALDSGGSGGADVAEGGGAEGGGAADGIIVDEPSTEVIELGSFTINLRDSAGGRLLQMDISLEGDSGASSVIKDRQAQLRDSVIMLASDFSYLELEGTDGRLRLRDEVHRRVNAVLSPEKINRVYFTKFVVQ
jgi:flagellar basal body-associated protein FliL